MLRKKYLPLLLLLLIIASGFWFRLTGILDNHSFWNDEAFVASVGRDLAQGKKNVFEAVKTAGIQYQPINVLIIAFSFKLFGFSEFSARLPYILIGAVGILFAFLLARRLSDDAGGLLAAFLYAFSELNLAHHTQAKSFVLIQTMILIISYLLLKLIRERKNKLLSAMIILLTATVYFTNNSGLLLVFLLMPYFLLHNKPIIIISTLIVLSYLLNIPQILVYFITPQNGKILFLYNYLPYLRHLFWNNYALISLPAFFGFIYSYKKNVFLSAGVLIWSSVLLFIWTFFYYSHNIRYLLPFIGLVFVYFGVFWSAVGKLMFNKNSWLICFIVALLLYAGGYKIVRKPLSYYSPNNDLRGDVQAADYKTFYRKLKDTVPDYKSYAIFNDVPDSQRWYLDKQPDAYFMKSIVKSFVSPLDGKMFYDSLEDFKKEINKYQKGLVVVEDWESLLPEDIKQYAKKNLKLEFRVEGLPQAQDDKWPLELYSWDQ